MYKTPFLHKILNLNINGTTYASLTELGIITDEGKCSGTSFTIDSITYLDSIMTSHYTIKVKQKSAIYHHSTQTVKFSDGSSCSYNKGHCNIYESTIATWLIESRRSSCGTNIYTVLYEGLANITSQSVLVVETDKQRFAMALKSEAIMCGHNGYKTGDDSIIVLTGSPSTLPNHEARESIDLNAFHNMDLILVYLERNIMNRTNDLMIRTEVLYCDLSRDHMYSLISLARTNSEEFAWVYMKQPGYTAVTRGEVDGNPLQWCHTTPVLLPARAHDALARGTIL